MFRLIAIAGFALSNRNVGARHDTGAARFARRHGNADCRWMRHRQNKN